MTVQFINVFGIIRHSNMFERFITGLGQRILETVGQAESFREDENFTQKLEEFKQTRIKVKDLCDKARTFLNYELQARKARLAYVYSQP